MFWGAMRTLRKDFLRKNKEASNNEYAEIFAFFLLKNVKIKKGNNFFMQNK